MDSKPSSWSLPSANVDADDTDGLDALTRFARLTAGADLAVAFEAADGVAVPLSSDPGPLPQPFRLAGARLDGADWTTGPQPVEGLRLPSALLAALGRPADTALFFPAPVAEAPQSGVLLLFATNAGRKCVCPFRSEVEGSVTLLGTAFAHVMAARRALRRRRLTSDRFRDLFDSVASAVVILEGDGTTALVNDRAAALLDMTAGEVPVGEVAGRMRALREGADNHAELTALYGPLQAKVDYAVTTVWALGERRMEVDTHPVLGDGRKGRIWLFNDVTAEVQQAEALRALAQTDALTGLANRRRFLEISEATLAGAEVGAASHAVLMLDIDHFKSVNDRFGHAVGDAVLRAVAGRCRAVLKAGDLPARLGGEEFAVLLANVERDEATAAAERLRAAVAATPVQVEAESVDVRISIGGTVMRPGDATVDTLLQRADAALYTAKRTGRNKVVFEGE
ncbi:GGDEF domain-containing protein [Pseudoxanthobacter sp. M-2]|uniref:GGDEF domain-containing protein n=1 Tax=Pseudoxanthobacter sp. M-2 TaxID=3078754 RepID=UPI0038FCE932